MPKIFDEKIEHTFFNILSDHEKNFLSDLGLRYHFTHQELKQIIDIFVDFQAWEEEKGSDLWTSFESGEFRQGRERKDSLFARLRGIHDEKIRKPKAYDRAGTKSPEKSRLKLETVEGASTIYGHCPVRSDKTVCCNLKTLDLVMNCGFGCSYCTIQTFSESTEGKVYFHKDLESKLANIHVDPRRRIHIGTGQASDSLMWGNQNGILNLLFRFANDHPSVILELKTKSRNVSYLVQNDVPSNMFCAWSVNPQTVIDNEEHLTASLDERLASARRVADKGVKVAFHFHPIIIYDCWKKDYEGLAQKILERFSPDEVLFISMGTLHFIRPVLKQIRASGLKTKVHQMPFVKNPEGKYTYPEEMKKEMFGHVWHALAPWHDKIFFYLCMESRFLWEQIFGRCYENNDAFEQDFLVMMEEKMRLEKL